MADKGKIDVIKDHSGGIVIDNKTGNKYEFFQIYHKELCLNQGDAVKYDLIPGTVYATNVERIKTGTISVVNLDNTTGVLIEKGSGAKINFYMAYLKENDINVGDLVRYDLINTADGIIAVNLVEVI